MAAIKRRNDGKSGRHELRKVSRTARRDKKNPKLEAKLESENESEDIEDEIADEPTEDKGMAYNALLTLIKEDHVDDTKHSKHKNKKHNALPEDDEIAGLNVEHDEESEDEEDLDGEEPLEDDQSDPYNVHFNQVSDDYIEEQEKVVTGKWPLKSKDIIDSYSYMYQVPPGKPLPTNDSIKPLEKLPIKQKILKQFQKEGSLSNQENILLNSMVNYKDINYPYSSYKNQSYKKLYVLHALNHIYKTRDTIIKNNSKLRNYEEQLKEGKDVPEVEYRDQGFTRPKVLILLPTRDSCYEVVDMLIKYSGTEQQDNKKRFTTQFHVNAEPPATKPDDFRHYFKGNTNDYFTMGIKFTRKSMKLYSSFYSSDIIVASPIGLSMILEHGDKKKREQDFLSSIEVVVVDNANMLEMQNWDHVNTVFKYLNQVPKLFHDADFSRIRMWSIDDKAKYFTQRLVFPEFVTPNTNSIVNKSMNLAGKIKFKKSITNDTCIMNSVGLKVKQIFQRFDSESPAEDPDSRFKYFINNVLNSVSSSTSYDDGLLIVVPSYFDFLRVKEYMRNHSKLSFEAVDEYSSQAKLTRARQLLISGSIKALLYSERLHHFRRFEIAGVKNIVLYGVPTNPLFYREYLKFIGKSVFNNFVDLNLAFVKVLFSKWDAVALERVVGNQRAPVLCNSINETYEFK